MSHFSQTYTKIKDAETLNQAIRNAGFKALVDSAVRGWQGNSIKAEVVAVMKGDYDIGFVRAEDGSFAAVADFAYGSCGGGSTSLGTTLNEIIRQYYLLEAQKSMPNASRDNISVRVHG